MHALRSVDLSYHISMQHPVRFDTIDESAGCAISMIQKGDPIV